MNKKLNAKQLLFCREFLISLNGTQSAINAGYSKRSARTQAARLLTNDNITAELSRLTEQRNNQLDIDATYVLKRHHEIDLLDVLDILEDDGSIKPISNWSQAWRRSISFINSATAYGDDGNLTNIKQIKFPDKVKNLELLGKHVDVNAYTDRKEFKGDLTLTHEDWLNQLD